MRKSVTLLAVLAAALFVTSCSTTKKVAKTETEEKTSTGTSKTAAPKVIGAEGVERPDWVMLGQESDDGIYAVGSAKMSTMQNSLKAARVNGRAELANTVQTTVKSAIATYAEDTGIPSDTLNYMEEATVAKTDAMLQGSKQSDYWVGPDSTVYVLMFLPYKAVVPATNEIVKDYVKDPKSEITEQKVAEALKKYNLTTE
jgi:hypothetical protein